MLRRQVRIDIPHRLSPAISKAKVQKHFQVDATNAMGCLCFLDICSSLPVVSVHKSLQLISLQRRCLAACIYVLNTQLYSEAQVPWLLWQAFVHKLIMPSATWRVAWMCMSICVCACAFYYRIAVNGLHWMASLFTSGRGNDGWGSWQVIC